MSLDLKDEIEKLNDTVSTISDVLLDAEEQQQHNNQVKVWLNRLKDAIYDADNLLDDISTEALRREVMTQNKKAKEVRIFFSKSNQLAYGFKMGRKVKAMRDRLDAIAKDRGFHLDERHVETQVVGYGMRETYSFVRDEEVIGRDYDKDKIIKILLNSNVEESVLILPIVGLGGLGKTTLAQLIFNDEKIQNHFEQRLWVCVSNDFEVEVIVMKILECTKNKKPENLEINTMINDFEKQIEGKRYLLVLDDVRNEDPQKWQSLKDLLKGGARGSTILVTTHDINILAKITQTVQPYMLKGLDDEKSWSLFKRFASAKGQDLENSNIKAIGMEIVAKCKGVPLAIRTLGSVLYFKNPEKEWLSFKDNELSKGLNELRETLEIRGLRHGKDAASESKGANMKEKQHLQGLKLWWQKEDVDDSDVGYDEESLEALHPHGPSSNLQQLHLIRYMGVKFPSGISLLSTLVNFSLSNCNNLQYLPPLDQFHSLKGLSLEFLNDLEYISERDYNRDLSDSLILPSLEKLQIHNCPNLKGWWQQQRDSIEKVNNHSLPSFPRLSNLYISVCLKLTSMPLFPYLEKLKLGICSLKPLEQTMSMEVINMTTSRNLISTFSSSTLATSLFIPLSKLKSMSIEYMVGTLPKEFMCNLISLQSLTIKYCCGPLPLSRHLTALQNLRITGHKEFDLTNDEDEMEWHGLQSLRHLMFNHLPNLATLPMGIQHLTSLQTLEIYYCQSLMAIPEWICNLTSLQTLKILSCPILLERCKRRAGKDWSKIAHIPYLYI
uniref:Uncharacterized protein n=1 Tax=Quercus lobata TaxID=97700 RepID=A0A7N2L8M6_QUELO